MTEAQRICASQDLQDGADGVRFTVVRQGQAYAAFAVRFQGQPRAYLNHCPHAGTELDWLPGRFFDASAQYLICATHAALFQADDGYCVAGPCAGASLQPVALVERADGIYIDHGYE